MIFIVVYLLGIIPMFAKFKEDSQESGWLCWFTGFIWPLCILFWLYKGFYNFIQCGEWHP